MRRASAGPRSLSRAGPGAAAALPLRPGSVSRVSCRADADGPRGPAFRPGTRLGRRAARQGRAVGGARHGTVRGSAGRTQPQAAAPPRLPLRPATPPRVRFMPRPRPRPRQWDQAAYVLFNSTLFNSVVQGFAAPDLSRYPPVLQKVGQGLSSPSLRPMCLQDYLTYLGADPMVYWVYEDGPAGPSQLTDACQVFTGPANSSALSSNQRSVFRECLDQYKDSNCQLSSNLWTAQSANAVPVA